MNKDMIPHNPQNPQQFMFGDHPVRIVTDTDGNPLFVASDVCRAIELSNVSQAVSRLDDDERGDIIINDVAGRPNKAIVVTESGVYSLILRSTKPSAREFRRWVTHEVIPSIRKTGSYIRNPNKLANPNHTLDALEAIVANLRQQQNQISALQWQQDNLQTDVQQIDTRLAKVEKRPLKNYHTVADYMFAHKRNETPERIALMEQWALELSSEMGYTVYQLEGNVNVFHDDVLKRMG